MSKHILYKQIDLNQQLYSFTPCASHSGSLGSMQYYCKQSFPGCIGSIPYYYKVTTLQDPEHKLPKCHLNAYLSMIGLSFVAMTTAI